MFNSKQTTIYSKKKLKLVKKASAIKIGLTDTPFVTSGLKKSAETLSGNGALKYSTTGNPFVDQFGSLSSFRQIRTFSDVASDCNLLYSIDPQLSVKFIFFLRTISRTVNLPSGEKTQVAQKGGELKHEGIMRMIWLHNKNEKLFWDNIELFVSIGSWKDIITMLQYDLVYNGWNGRVLNWDKMAQFIITSTQNPNHIELIKKYLPQIKSLPKCKTIESMADNVVAKWIAGLLFGGDYKQYRQFKSSGAAHSWQQLISQSRFDEIEFEKIHGRALNLLVRGKFLKNNGLSEKYNEWIKKPENVDVKYTGFVHELFNNLPDNQMSLSESEQMTINKQFMTLVNKTMSENNLSNLIVVRDTSGSMDSIALGTTMTCNNVGKALALYFSYFLKGQFSNAFIEFNRNAIMKQWIGTEPIDKWYNENSRVVGGTNFMSVIQLFVSIKKSGVSESDFPSGILCISDNEFNPSSLNKTNVESAKELLLAGGFSREYVDNFTIVLWNLANTYYGKHVNKFETYGNVPNVYYFSGYSASIVSFLSSHINNAWELFNESMNQEVLNMIRF